MAQPLVTALDTALSQCAAADLTRVARRLISPRWWSICGGSATRLEAEIARTVHAASQVEVWRTAGATSMEAWLAAETQVSFRSARDQVRLAGTLAAAPIVAAKMADGELSVDNVRLLGTVVGNEQLRR